jgi:hypothetical protein
MHIPANAPSPRTRIQRTKTSRYHLVSGGPDDTVYEIRVPKRGERTISAAEYVRVSQWYARRRQAAATRRRAV